MYLQQSDTSLECTYEELKRAQPPASEPGRECLECTYEELKQYFSNFANAPFTRLECTYEELKPACLKNSGKPSLV